MKYLLLLILLTACQKQTSQLEKYEACIKGATVVMQKLIAQNVFIPEDKLPNTDAITNFCNGVSQ